MTEPALSKNQNWGIVVLGFLALALAFSTRAALSLMMPIWQNELGWTSSFISNSGAGALIVMAIVAPFSGRLVDRKSPRFAISMGLVCIALGCTLVASTSHKFIFVLGFSGFCGIGFGIVATHVISTMVVLSFDRHQGLATGIATSGATGGQFLIVPLIASLLAYASWRWSFAGLAIASILLVPWIWRIMSHTKAQTTVTIPPPDDEPSITDDVKFTLKKPAFHVLFWSFLICGFTTTGVIETHLLPFASFCGFPPIPSAAAYGFLSAVNLVGMITVGWLTDRMNRPYLLALIYILRGLTFLFLSNMPGANIETLFLFAALFGAVDYSTIPVTASLVASHVGRHVMGLAMGMIGAGHAIGGALGASFGGYVFDATGAYDTIWAASLWLSIGAGGLILLLPAKGIKVQSA